MDMDQVRTFLEVVEAGSFVRAAESLNVTQSTVSARIKELEVRLGQPLFIRRKSGVALTTAGKRFQPHAATMMHVLQQARLRWVRDGLGQLEQRHRGLPESQVGVEVGGEGWRVAG